MASSIVEVSCAIIESDGKVLVAQRAASMAHPFQWEFPGGKWEAGESAENALVREIAEELGLRIAVVEALPPSMHTYEPTKTIRLWPFRCSLLGGQLRLLEHARADWLPPQALAGLDWVAADVPIWQGYLAEERK